MNSSQGPTQQAGLREPRSSIPLNAHGGNLVNSLDLLRDKLDVIDAYLFGGAREVKVQPSPPADGDTPISVSLGRAEQLLVVLHDRADNIRNNIV